LSRTASPSPTKGCDQDGDQDGVGDILVGSPGRRLVCDNCPGVPNTNQADRDNDGVGDLCDNCPDRKNEDQANGDGDALGDVRTVAVSLLRCFAASLSMSHILARVLVSSRS
jgi:hypothetical protein